jgi:hypothetical protein
MNNTEMIQARKRQQQEFLIKTLKRAISETDKMWAEKVSHAQIIGYLQGTISVVARELENSSY